MGFKQEFNNVSQEVYGATNGQIKLPGYSNNTTNIRQGIYESVYNVAANGARDTENNSIYDTAKRIERVSAVTSILTSGYASAKTVSTYNNIDFNSTQVRQTLDNIGYGTRHADNVRNIISTGTFYDNNGNQIKLNPNDILNNQTIMNQIQATGSFDSRLISAQVYQPDNNNNNNQNYPGSGGRSANSDNDRRDRINSDNNKRTPDNQSNNRTDTSNNKNQFNERQTPSNANNHNPDRYNQNPVRANNDNISNKDNLFNANRGNNNQSNKIPGNTGSNQSLNQSSNIIEETLGNIGNDVRSIVNENNIIAETTTDLARNVNDILNKENFSNTDNKQSDRRNTRPDNKAQQSDRRTPQNDRRIPPNERRNENGKEEKNHLGAKDKNNPDKGNNKNPKKPDKNSTPTVGSRIQITSYTSPNGNQVPITQTSLQREMNLATSEKNKRNKILHASTKKEKKEALLEIRRGQIAELNNRGGVFAGLTNKNATPCKMKSIERTLDKEKNKLLSEKNKLLNQGKSLQSTEVKKIDDLLKKNTEDKDALNQFMSLGGQADERQMGKEQNQRKYGQRIVAQKVAGQDFMMGYKFYERNAKLTKSAVSLGYRTVASAGLGVAQAGGKVIGAFSSGINKGLTFAGVGNDNLFVKANTKIASGSDKLASASKETRKNIKSDSKLSKKDRREVRRDRRKDRRNENRVKRQEKLDGQIANLKGKEKLTPREQRKLNRKEARKRRNTRINDRLANIKARFEWATRLRERWLNLKISVSNSRIARILKAPGKFVDFAKELIDRFKKAVFMKVVLPIVAGILAFFLIFVTPIILPIAVSSFFMSGTVDKIIDTIFPSATVEALKNVNYVQLIVNETASGLSQSYLETAKKDAEKHYLESTDSKDRENSNYDWQKGVNEGQLGKITASEDGREIPSLNSNLLPIMSMMHYRYNDDIGFEEYYTAKGGAWIQYVMSHRVKGYESRNEDDCSEDTIYKTPVTSSSWNKETKTLSRPEEVCTNVYIHGYTKEFGKTVNKLRSNMLNYLDKAIGALNSVAGSEVLPALGLQEQGVWVQKIPSDSKGNCKNYIAVQYGTEVTDLWVENDKQPSNGIATGDFNNATNAGCPGIHIHTVEDCYEHSCSHTHTDDCYPTKDVTTETSEKKYKTISFNTCFDNKFKNMSATSSIFNLLNDFTDKEVKDLANKYNEQFNKICNADKKNVALKDLGKLNLTDTKVNLLYGLRSRRALMSPNQMSVSWTVEDGYKTISSTTTIRDYSNPSKCTHVCTIPSETQIQNNEGTSCYKIKCTRPYHYTHNNWKNANEPGCWKTAYICGGHCGGHITPLINIEMDMKYETMMNYSDYKTLYFLAENDFKSIHDIFGFSTLDDWYGFWNARMMDWYTPFPNSITSFTQWVGNKAMVGYMKFLDFIHGEKGEGSTESLNGKDVYDFDGWLLADGKPDQSKVDDLISLYGSWEKNYEEGIKNWEDFDVTFPMGAGAALTSSQKNMVLDAVKKKYPDISQQRIDVITEALDRVGSYYYECTGTAHMNGINNLEGKSECSGFVSGVLSRALGKNIDHFAAEYAGLGHSYSDYPNSVIAGDVGAHSNGGAGYTGHVVLVLGQLDLPPKEEFNFYYCNKSQEQIFVGGSGYYIIDCTSPQGSCIRAISNPAKYGSIWRGCYD